jgi:hypothetical protein
MEVDVSELLDAFSFPEAAASVASADATRAESPQQHGEVLQQRSTQESASEELGGGGHSGRGPASAGGGRRRGCSDCRYALVAVVEHLGGAYGGHYVAYVRRRMQPDACNGDESMQSAGATPPPGVTPGGVTTNLGSWVLMNDCRSKNVRSSAFPPPHTYKHRLSPAPSPPSVFRGKHLHICGGNKNGPACTRHICVHTWPRVTYIAFFSFSSSLVSSGRCLCKRSCRVNPLNPRP